jgi:CRISPR system Cascade subunit CasE
MALKPESPRESLGVLFRLDKSADGRLALLVQSSEVPDWTKLPSGYLSVASAFEDEGPNPAVRSIDAMLGAFAVGAELRFRLRANPTKKIDTKTGSDGKRRNGRRVPLRTEAERAAWLKRKGEQHGFRVLDVEQSGPPTLSQLIDVTEGRAIGYRPGSNPEQEKMTFASTVFEGRLAVTNANAFRETVTNGIGSGKAFGFGLLSLAV